ncbi:hypothetical protein VSR01_14350 [Actinacidiphila sp. DG2A-62]|uniref:hypothetical protein n=1 Tax=Actinacidiphila sp. DG2A-62 TaxID=3108821 RepID=UPI002DC01E3D|nr:hypothetical protein [Actinacidiphila sp. DG2A-62]MEC3994640.1 hypothetical protein [Actinacidiphila sp. DG2A-62]
MSSFDHEWADEALTDEIALYLDAQQPSVTVEFIRVLDEALCGEWCGKLRGEYPPAGHGYPREGL